MVTHTIFLEWSHIQCFWNGHAYSVSGMVTHTMLVIYIYSVSGLVIYMYTVFMDWSHIQHFWTGHIYSVSGLVIDTVLYIQFYSCILKRIDILILFKIFHYKGYTARHSARHNLLYYLYHANRGRHCVWNSILIFTTHYVKYCTEEC